MNTPNPKLAAFLVSHGINPSRVTPAHVDELILHGHVTPAEADELLRVFLPAHWIGDPYCGPPIEAPWKEPPPAFEEEDESGMDWDAWHAWLLARWREEPRACLAAA